uniref:Putative plasma membrane sensor n=1 Tax=Ixodes ricinus TaxID=34613 RepID=A0A0K8RAV4_IXORI
MLLLKVILVVLISKIDSGPAPSVQKSENAPKTLPPGSLITQKDSVGCSYTLLPFFEEATMGGGFLVVNCRKSCPDGKEGNVVDGNQCAATLNCLNDAEVEVTVGSCDHGSCKPVSPSKHLTVALMVEGEEEEG